jgi:hypothetical protein
MSEQIAAEVIAALKSERREPTTKLSAPAELIRGMEARHLLGGGGTLDRLVRAGWITPVSQTKRLTLYARKDVEATAYRIAIEGLP